MPKRAAAVDALRRKRDVARNITAIRTRGFFKSDLHSPHGSYPADNLIHATPARFPPVNGDCARTPHLWGLQIPYPDNAHYQNLSTEKLRADYGKVKCGLTALIGLLPLLSDTFTEIRPQPWRKAAPYQRRLEVPFFFTVCGRQDPHFFPLFNGGRYPIPVEHPVLIM